MHVAINLEQSLPLTPMYDLLSQSSILIIDDFAQFRATIKTMLYKLGAIEVDQASSAVEAMKLGAADYIIRPFEMETVELAVARALTMGMIVFVVVAVAPSVDPTAVVMGQNLSRDSHAYGVPQS